MLVALDGVAGRPSLGTFDLRLRRSRPPLRLQGVEAGNSLFVILNGAAVSDFLYRRGPSDRGASNRKQDY